MRDSLDTLATHVRMVRKAIQNLRPSEEKNEMVLLTKETQNGLLAHLADALALTEDMRKVSASSEEPLAEFALCLGRVQRKIQKLRVSQGREDMVLLTEASRDALLAHLEQAMESVDEIKRVIEDAEAEQVEPPCDKCGGPVPPWNDAARVAFQVSDRIELLRAEPRHFLPVEGCEGSPSRAQYIEGQPRDDRRGASYDESEEAVWRAAYDRLLELYPPPRA